MSKELTIEQIQSLMKSVADNSISELLFETEGVKLKIKGKAAETQIVAAPAAPAPVAVTATATVQNEQVQITAPVQDAAKLVTSPIVGTFYASSSPDKDAFVKPGQSISKGEILFIVESMKVMNEVPAEVNGTVAEILVENGQAVEYGQPILRLE